MMKVFLSASIVLAFTSLGAVADPLFYEGFDYPGGALSDNDGWTQSENISSGEEWMVEEGESLGYFKNGKTLATSGGRARAMAVDSNVSTAHRSMDQAFNSGVVWVSFLVSRDSELDKTTLALELAHSKEEEPGAFYKNVALGSDAAALGYGAYVNPGPFEVIPATEAVPSVDPGEADLFVAEIVFPAGDDNEPTGRVTIYVNPEPGDADPADTAEFTMEVDGKNRFQLEFDLAALTYGWALQRSGSIDEIRVGETFEIVTPLAE